MFIFGYFKPKLIKRQDWCLVREHDLAALKVYNNREL